MAAMREPRTPNVPPKRTFREQLVLARKILREDKQFRTLIISRLLINTWTIGLPFIILFGTKRFGFGLQHTDIFITAECIGLIISNFLWQRIELKHGPKKVLIGSCIVAMMVPLFILSMSFFDPPVYLFAILFGLTASFDAAVTVGGLGYLIEMTGDADRSTYVGIFNTLMALPCFLTAGAGILLDVTGFETLYIIVFLIALASLYRVRHLPSIQLKHSS
jgi:predicted MFS family arabinose efflux permease